MVQQKSSAKSKLCCIIGLKVTPIWSRLDFDFSGTQFFFVCVLYSVIVISKWKSENVTAWRLFSSTGLVCMFATHAVNTYLLLKQEQAKKQKKHTLLYPSFHKKVRIRKYNTKILAKVKRLYELFFCCKVDMNICF